MESSFVLYKLTNLIIYHYFLHLKMLNVILLQQIYFEEIQIRKMFEKKF